nr:hypothetical protein [Planococcus salinarum]
MDLQKIIHNQKAHKQVSQDETAAAKYGMAASAIKEATEIGEQVLEDGAMRSMPLSLSNLRCP